MTNILLLRMREWDQIREQFTEEEKAILNRSIVGETICPRGCSIDTDALGKPLAFKLKLAVRTVREAQA